MRQKNLDILYEKYRDIYRNQEIVLGDGDIHSKILLIGEAPGKDEVIQGKPFVGKAGKKLNEFIELADLDRKDIYVTNAIKYRLFELNEKNGRKRNRPAKLLEIIENRAFLIAEIDIIKPKFIVTLGNVPLKSIMNDKKSNIGDMHGKLYKIDINYQEYHLFPLYHPASIIYNRNLAAIYEQDILELNKLIHKNEDTKNKPK